MSDKLLLDRYVVVAEMMATMMHPFAETVVVDHRQIKPVVYAIFNNHVTGRSQGFPTSDFGKLRLTKDIPDTLFNYANLGPKNQKLKSSAIAIRNDSNDLIGVLAVHFELTQLGHFSELLTQFSLTADSQPHIQEKENFFFVESEDEIKKLIHVLLGKQGVKSNRLTKVDREKIMDSLIESGVFKQKKAITTVASELSVSRQWVYTHLRSKTS